VDEGIREDYTRFITQAGIRDAMTIENFLNPVEEEALLQEIELIDEEEWIIQSAETVQVDEKQEAAEADVVALHSDLSLREELQALAKAIAVYEKREHPLFETNTIVGALRSVQRRIRWEIERERAKNLMQTTIKQYFGSPVSPP